jgi:hypothetical protein
MSKIIYGIFLLTHLFYFCYPQQNFIKNVPDYSQPPTDSLPSTLNKTNYCAPFALMNIVSYWDSIQQHPYALGEKAALPATECTEYIGWLMDTNDQGSNVRDNGNTRLSAAGTYAFDQWWGSLEYIEFDTAHIYGFPYTVPQLKRGYGWDIQMIPVADFLPFKAEIDSGNPVVIDFLYWIIYKTGEKYYNTDFASDTIYFYNWAAADSFSGSIDEQDPYERWNLLEGDNNIGHAVTAVGYFENYKPPDTSFVIVHDNWSNTPRNIAVPWANIACWFFIHLPDLPDLTIIHSDALIDTSAGVPDSLWINDPITVRNTIKNIGSGGAAYFIIDIRVIDPDDLLIASDTMSISYNLIPDDSIQVTCDTLFRPQKAGNYKIVSHVHWDQNNDSFINDPDDFNAQNDTMLFNLPVFSPLAIDCNNQIVEAFQLDQNFPNPFNPLTEISYEIPYPCWVELTIYNLLGQKVTTLVNKKQTKGLYTCKWNAEHFSSGIYIYGLRAGKYLKFKKMALLK